MKDTCTMCKSERPLPSNSLCIKCCELLDITPRVNHHGICDTHLPLLIGNDIKECILKNEQLFIDCENCRDCNLVKSILNLDVKKCLEVPKTEPQTTNTNLHCNGKDRCLSCQESTKVKETKSHKQKYTVYTAAHEGINVIIVD